MKKIFLFSFVALYLLACDNSQTKTKEDVPEEALKVFAVNYPLLYFAERIGGEHVEAMYPIPSDIDPAYWIPGDALSAIQASDLILANGADYAKWMEKVSLPSSKLINTSEAFKDNYIQIQQGDTHSHGGGGEHVHYGYAFTTWLDFKNAQAQAESIKDAFVSKRPEQKSVFEKNFAALKADLQKLDAEMTGVAENLPEIAIFASHPVYQYLGKAYGLDIYSEHWEPGEMPTEKQWGEFKHNLDHHPANLMLWEGDASDDVKNKLQDFKVSSVVFNPCGNTPAKGDFISVMRQNIKNLETYIAEFC